MGFMRHCVFTLWKGNEYIGMMRGKGCVWEMDGERRLCRRRGAVLKLGTIWHEGCSE